MTNLPSGATNTRSTSSSYVIGKSDIGDGSVYTREEVARHNRYEDCWVILDGEVLSLPKDFLEDHPGGSDVIFQRAGKDVTQDFNDQSHTASASDWARRYAIGTCCDGSPRWQDSRRTLFTLHNLRQKLQRLPYLETDIQDEAIIEAKQQNSLVEGRVASSELVELYEDPELHKEYVSLTIVVLSAISAGILAWRLVAAMSTPTRKS